MPVGLPPRGGPLGRSRGRISASALTTYLRCPRQWLLKYQAGLQGPTRPSQILGVVIEEALCELFMLHPPNTVDGLDALRAWAQPHGEQYAQQALKRGREAWNSSLWKHDENAWEVVELQRLVDRINGGLDLFLEEVEACFAAGGGPYLDTLRTGNAPFPVPAPTRSAQPVFPLPDKVPDGTMRRWQVESGPEWNGVGSAIGWHEAWECARPWFKDPRVHQPQRLYHPDGWASGELDLVLRWDGNVRIIDIKSGRPSSLFAGSLEHQLRFYAWLWHETHQDSVVSGMEGWYLDGGKRVAYDAPKAEDMTELTNQYHETHTAMQKMVEGVLTFPASPREACDGSAAGCDWCAVSFDTETGWNLPEHLKWLSSVPQVSKSSHHQNLASIQGRVNVRGRLTGAWGPLPNHFSEPVLGAVLVVGDQHITIEESEPGAFPHLHESMESEVVLIDALPGVWRDQPRLYLDGRSSCVGADDAADSAVLNDITRLGLLRTRANVFGHVLSIGQRSGIRVDGKPWSMVSLMLWDGTHVAEVVAFGTSISQRLLGLRPGDAISMTGVELRWRSVVLQLRIDNRKTRLDSPLRR